MTEERVDAPENQNTPFEEIGREIERVKKDIMRANHVNPQFIKQLIVNEILPIISEGLKISEGYIMDLARRVFSMQSSNEDNLEEIISPDLSLRLIEFIGKTMDICKSLIEKGVMKDDIDTMAIMQDLMINSPALIHDIQAITGVDVPDVEEEDPTKDDDVIAPTMTTVSDENPEQLAEYLHGIMHPDTMWGIEAASYALQVDDSSKVEAAVAILLKEGKVRALKPANGKVVYQSIHEVEEEAKTEASESTDSAGVNPDVLKESKPDSADGQDGVTTGNDNGSGDAKSGVSSDHSEASQVSVTA